MPQQPDAESAPRDGALPSSALATVGQREFGIYLHVPFCASRCGYCDFNTYTPGELGSGNHISTYLAAVREELQLARRVLGDEVPQVSTVFVGGGTPTLLPAEELAGLLEAIAAAFPLSPTAEVTTEANPESVTSDKLAVLRNAGFNRLSLGMQSAASHVLAMLERTHTPGRSSQAVAMARAAGFEQVSLDLIYGAAVESDDDWRRSLAEVVAADVDHVSAYALIVEQGTRLARQVAAGVLAAPDDDVLADRYLIAESVLTTAGFSWYEISNWSKDDHGRCRHNMNYWRNQNWWGLGPGAHSHVGGVRWWNEKLPGRYAAALSAGVSPAAAREVTDDRQRELETVMLGIRLADGLPLGVLSYSARRRLGGLAAAGLLTTDETAIQLTMRGRLLADAVVRELV